MNPPSLALHTRRYSEVFRHILTEYNDGTFVDVNGKTYAAREFPELIEQWCSNSRIKATRDFVLRRGEIELFGFHDCPDELWARGTELAFIKRLAAQQLLRFRAFSPSRPSKMQSFLSLLFSPFRRSAT